MVQAAPGLDLQEEQALPSSAVCLPMEVIDLTADLPMNSAPLLGACMEVTTGVDSLTQIGSGAGSEARNGQTRKTTQRALPRSWVIQDKPSAPPVQQSLHASWGMGHSRQPGGVQSTPGLCCNSEATLPLLHGSQRQACSQPELHSHTRREGLGTSGQGVADGEPPGLCDGGGSSGSCILRDPMAELTARGLSIHSLKEVLPEEIRWGQIRLAAAHVGRTGLLGKC